MIKKALFESLGTKIKSLRRKLIGHQSFSQKKSTPECGREYLQVNQGDKEANGFIFILPRCASTIKSIVMNIHKFREHFIVRYS